MSSLDDSHLPPLPDEARFALSAFRTERPSPQQESRLRAALQAAEPGQARSGRHSAQGLARAWSHRRALWAITGAVLAGVLLTVGLELTSWS